MNGKEIRFAKEYHFNARCSSNLVELKEREVYEYQNAAGALTVGNASGFVPVEILDVKSDVLRELDKYAGRSLLRLDKANQETGMYAFTLLSFYQHTHFDDPYQVVIDAAIYPELRRRKIDMKNPAKYFMEELVFDGKYWFAFGDDRRQEEQRLYGKRISILVKLSPQGYLHIIDIRDNRNAPENLITLMSGKIEFKDSTEDLQRVTREFMDKYRSATRDNAELIELWRIYDNLDQEAIKSDAAEMGYIQYKSYRRSGGNLIFSVEGGYVPSDFLRSDIQYAVLGQEDFNQDEPMNYDPRDAIAIGSEFDKRCVHTKEFVISEDYVDAFKKLPDHGYILPSINGSVIQSRRRRVARNRILNGENPLLGLNLLLQSGDIVGVKGKELPAVTDHLRRYIFGADRKRDFNDRQKDAIRIAINTPDIAVIQGPPGTGKTQAIKAIVARINELENGEARILITSTQHDAVDNAVKGMSYSGVPVNRVFTGERAASADMPVFGWIDEMISACGAWLKQHHSGSATQELFLCLEALQSCSPEEASPRTKELYHLLQGEGYSGQLLAQVNETAVSLIDAAQPAAGEGEASRLKELLDCQRLDVEGFLADGRQNLTLLERYLKYDAEDVEFEIPPYWKELKRASPDTPELERLVTDFRKDVTALRKQCGSLGEPEAAGKAKEHIVRLVAAVKAEMTARERDMTLEQTAYQQIWQFKHELSNIKNVKDLVSSYSQVNAATCQQSANKYISPAMHGFEDIYDYVIIDEAARSNPLDLLIPMSMGKKIILVGDHKQLPHMVERDIVDAVVQKTKDEHAAQVLEESLFMRLFQRVREADARALTDPEHPVRLTRTCTLNEQYRMHSAICDLVNVFYGDEKLKTACSDEEKLHGMNLYRNKPLAWIDVPPAPGRPYETPGRSKSRPCEVAVIKKELSKILAANAAYEVGIITFYGKQAELLRQMVEEEFPGDLHRISVGTVDAFQGKEFDVVLLSAVRSNRETELKRRVGFLSSDNRLCVAFSRARRLLIMVGDSATVANSGGEAIVKPLDELYQRCKRGEVGYYEAL